MVLGLNPILFYLTGMTVIKKCLNIWHKVTKHQRPPLQSQRISSYAGSPLLVGTGKGDEDLHISSNGNGKKAEQVMNHLEHDRGYEQAPVAELYPPQGKWTEADYFALPDTNRYVELSEGRLIMPPHPTRSHQIAVEELYIRLHAFVKGGD